VLHSKRYRCRYAAASAQDFALRFLIDRVLGSESADKE
jgi:hypothetical protein